MAAGLMALIGAASGSFLNLCVDRLPKRQSLLAPPSHCDSCGGRLGPGDLIPIISFLALRRRCRRCGAVIPWRVLIVEVLTAAALGYIGYRFGLSREAIVVSLYVMVLVLVAFLDLEQGIIPNGVVLPAMLAAVGLSALLPDVGPVRALIGGAVAFGTMLAVYLAARGGMGGGDVKLAAFVGLATGFPLVVQALMIAAMSGGLIAIVLLGLKKKRRGDTVPFGPMLAFGAAVSLLWGPGLLHAWLSLGSRT